MHDKSAMALVTMALALVVACNEGPDVFGDRYDDGTPAGVGGGGSWGPGVVGPGGSGAAGGSWGGGGSVAEGGSTPHGGGGSSTTTSSSGAGGQTSTTTSGAGGGGGLPLCMTSPTCAHDVCESGVALDPSCDPCVAAVCAVDPACCTAPYSWGGACNTAFKLATQCGCTCGE